MMDSDILFYLRKKTISKITVVENDEEIESHMHQERAVVVAHFRSNQSLKYRYFEDAVKDMDDVDCLCGFGENKMSEPVDSLTVTSTEGRVSTFDGKWNVEELKRFIATNALPLVVPYSSYWNRFIFSGDHGIRVHGGGRGDVVRREREWSVEERGEGPRGRVHRDHHAIRCQ